MTHALRVPPEWVTEVQVLKSYLSCFSEIFSPFTLFIYLMYLCDWTSFIFLIYFIDYAVTVVPFPPFIPLHLAHPLPPTFPPIVHVHGSCI